MQSSAANLFNSVCLALVATSHLYFTLLFNDQLSLVCCATPDHNEYHNLPIPLYLPLPRDSLVQLINQYSLFVYQSRVGCITLPFICLCSSSFCHLLP